MEGHSAVRRHARRSKRGRHGQAKNSGVETIRGQQTSSLAGTSVADIGSTGQADKKAALQRSGASAQQARRQASNVHSSSTVVVERQGEVGAKEGCVSRTESTLSVSE